MNLKPTPHTPDPITPTSSTPKAPMPKTKRPSLRKQVATRFLYAFFGLVGLSVVYLCTACAFQRCGVFPTCFMNERPFRGGYKGMKRLWISTPQGKVEAWFVPVSASRWTLRHRRYRGYRVTRVVPDSTGPHTSPPPPRGTPPTERPAVIYAHGNGETIENAGRIVRGYHRLGVHVMLCEYRGYGRSAGSPSQRRIVADYVKCRKLLERLPEVDKKRIFYHGYSLGTGVVSALSMKRPPAGLILQAPFTSMAAMLWRYLIPRLFVLDPFDNMAALKRYRGPVLLLHGTRDKLIPVSHSKKLLRAANDASLETFNCGHNGFTYNRRYWAIVKRFLVKKVYPNARRPSPRHPPSPRSHRSRPPTRNSR